MRKGYSVIKRIGLLLVAALMAAMMMVATAAPAFAAPGCPEGFTSVKDPDGGWTCKAAGDPNPKFECEQDFNGTAKPHKDSEDETLNPQGKPTKANQCR